MKVQVCHLCEAETEWTCHDCTEPVCEDCCVPYDQFTQIDYTLCTSCHEGDQARAALEHWRQEDIIKEKTNKRLHSNKLAKNVYWRPENAKKRKLERAERKKREAELARKHLAETFKVVSSWFN